jgi:hypothetical protein
MEQLDHNLLYRWFVGLGADDFHGEKRSNETHASTTDPEAKLYRKVKARRPSSPTSATP